MKKILKPLAIVFTLMLALQACTEEIEPTPPPEDPNRSRIEFDLNGQEWKSESVSSLEVGPLFQIVGNKGAQVLQIGFFNNEIAPGNYDLSGIDADISIQFIGLGEAYNAEPVGTMELLINDNNSIAGRFNVTLTSVLSNKSITLSNGKFLYER